MPTTGSTTTEDIGQAAQLAFSVVQRSPTQGPIPIMESATASARKTTLWPSR
jgi:hypothetical protein